MFLVVVLGGAFGVVGCCCFVVCGGIIFIGERRMGEYVIVFL